MILQLTSGSSINVNAMKNALSNKDLWEAPYFAMQQAMGEGDWVLSRPGNDAMFAADAFFQAVRDACNVHALEEEFQRIVTFWLKRHIRFRLKSDSFFEEELQVSVVTEFQDRNRGGQYLFIILPEHAMIRR